jgi:hypothetical protein
MDSNSASPGSPDAIAAPQPPLPFEPLLAFKPAGLRLKSVGLLPVWVGLALTVAGFFVYALLAKSVDAETSRTLAALWGLPALLFYFMIVHRVVRVLDAQPGWSVGYTPAAAVWKHFIPIYAPYFLYRWPKDVERYINWRLGRESRVGLWSFLGLITGFLLRWFDNYVGWLVIMASLYILYVPLRKALATAPSTDAPAMATNGTLGLR